ncbi:hypothetical protein CEXT_254121 [Caerostris extrusa]|uniref:Uncharacterized protein n=1 Tax=Caerostris extrusa TaxID=172846 RepID=A0AAV4SLY3_CAEEX|nr:hypothetical protein CEXT_254121 [Caerostris extrusa]
MGNRFSCKEKTIGLTMEYFGVKFRNQLEEIFRENLFLILSSENDLVRFAISSCTHVCKKPTKMSLLLLCTFIRELVRFWFKEKLCYRILDLCFVALDIVCRRHLKRHLRSLNATRRFCENVVESFESGKVGEVSAYLLEFEFYALERIKSSTFIHQSRLSFPPAETDLLRLYIKDFIPPNDDLEQSIDNSGSLNKELDSINVELNKEEDDLHFSDDDFFVSDDDGEISEHEEDDSCCSCSSCCEEDASEVKSTDNEQSFSEPNESSDTAENLLKPETCSDRKQSLSEAGETADSGKSLKDPSEICQSTLSASENEPGELNSELLSGTLQDASQLGRCGKSASKSKPSDCQQKLPEANETMPFEQNLFETTVSLDAGKESPETKQQTSDASFETRNLDNLPSIVEFPKCLKTSRSNYSPESFSIAPDDDSFKNILVTNKSIEFSESSPEASASAGSSKISVKKRKSIDNEENLLKTSKQTQNFESSPEASASVGSSKISVKKRKSIDNEENLLKMSKQTQNLENSPEASASVGSSQISVRKRKSIDNEQNLLEANEQTQNLETSPKKSRPSVICKISYLETPHSSQSSFDSSNLQITSNTSKCDECVKNSPLENLSSDSSQRFSTASTSYHRHNPPEIEQCTQDKNLLEKSEQTRNLKSSPEISRPSVIRKISFLETSHSSQSSLDSNNPQTTPNSSQCDEFVKNSSDSSRRFPTASTSYQKHNFSETKQSEGDRNLFESTEPSYFPKNIRKRSFDTYCTADKPTYSLEECPKTIKSPYTSLDMDKSAESSQTFEAGPSVRNIQGTVGATSQCEQELLKISKSLDTLESVSQTSKSKDSFKESSSKSKSTVNSLLRKVLLSGKTQTTQKDTTELTFSKITDAFLQSLHDASERQAYILQSSSRIKFRHGWQNITGTNTSRESLYRSPEKSELKDPLQNHPLTSESRDPSESLPGTSESRDPGESLPGTSESRDPGESLPGTSESRDPVVSLPGTSESRDPIDSLPGTSESTDSIDSLPGTTESTDSIDSILGTSESTDFIDSFPGMSESTDSIDSLPGTSESTDSSESLPGTCESADPSESLPGKSESTDPSESLPE